MIFKANGIELYRVSESGAGSCSKKRWEKNVRTRRSDRECVSADSHGQRREGGEDEHEISEQVSYAS